MKKSIFDPVNASKWICSHLAGHKHSTWHHMVTGLIMIATGTLISASGEGYVHLITEALGFMVHGFGCVPFIEELTKEV